VTRLKKILGLHSAPRQHWVGDGFPVRSLFSYDGDTKSLSPFLLLDYASPAQFEPAAQARGVGVHPHRGFETVTIVYQGEVDHHDSTGSGGHIGPGDVQWMTAASGILHKEFHSQEFTRKGGTLEMAQLWVNLPAKDKKAPPGYQSILDSQIPKVGLPKGRGSVRVIAGEFAGVKGPARTFTPIHVWDLRLTGDERMDLAVPDGFTTALVVLRGALRVNGSEEIRAAEVGLFDRAGESLCVDGAKEATALLLCGEPIDEPVAGQGPFVMNSGEEIRQAMVDYQSGKMGRLS
jgi:quercetin 2,3-dioxygenase